MNEMIQMNDFFELDVNCQLESFHIAILNRWGEVVFESNDPHFKWDGSYKSRHLSEGVYFYKLTANYFGGGSEVFHGHITLIR